MNAAISVKIRGTRSASSARSTSGYVVVAPSSTALAVPSVALTVTAANTARPLSRTSGRKAAASTTGGNTTRARRQITPAGTRARSATAVSTHAAATYTGHADR